MVNGTPKVIAVSGGISSGKTTLSSELVKSLNCPRASFGDFLRHLAGRKNLDMSRERLRDLGETLVNSDPRGFCLDVINHSQWSPGQWLVVDGVRHLEILQALRQIVSPQRVIAIYLAVPTALRVLRSKGKDTGTMNELDSHSTECQVPMLLSDAADLTLNGEKNLEELVQSSFDFLYSQ